MAVRYYHADVFSSEFLSGNGLTVFFYEEDLDTRLMQRLAQEFKQFETVFLRQKEARRFRARIFTQEEELDFAGHPVLGAVCAIHDRYHASDNKAAVTFELNRKVLRAESLYGNGCFHASMNQGIPEFLGIVEGKPARDILHALNLTPEDLCPSLPMEVVSTGLPYLIVPLESGLDRAKIGIDYFEAILKSVNAKFVYVLDVPRMEGRTWDNLGAVEDVATGSASGPAAAYLYKRGLRSTAECITINQGGFVGRPSKIMIQADPDTGELIVSGEVRIVARGELLLDI